MATLCGIYRTRMDKFHSGLSECKDVTAAADYAMAFVDSILHDFTAQEKNAQARFEANKMLQFGKSALACLYSANKVQISAMPEIKIQTNNTADIKSIMRHSPVILSLLLTAALLAGGNFWLILLGIGSAASCVWQYIKKPERPDLVRPALPQGTVRVNAPELGEKLEHIFMLADQQIASLSASEPNDEPVVWTQPQYQALQALWEARHAQDGAYALKSIAPLQEELERQGVEILTFSQDARPYFDCLPGMTKDDTIRPAMKKGSRLIARGQATADM